MSERIDRLLRSISVGETTTNCNVAPPIKLRDDIDGCGCLECRNIETTTTSRSVLDALAWSVRLFRSHPSIVAFAGVVIFANRLVETDTLSVLPIPVIGVFEALTTFTFVFLLRAYVGTIVAGELTDEPVTVRGGLHRSVTRIPALIGLIVLLVFFIMTIPSLLTFPLLVLVGVILGNPVAIVGFPAVAVIGGLVFVVPFLFLVFKFWFAPEACVIGGYGPITSLRVSWRLTTNYRGKFVLVAIIAFGSAISLYVPTLLPDIGSSLTSITPVLRVLSASVSESLSVVWAGAYAHVYVQGIVS